VILPEDNPWVVQVQPAAQEILADVVAPEKRQAPGFRQKLAQRLDELKKSYIAGYLALHTRARLGVNEERRRNALLCDPRFATLQKLAAIDLLPAGKLAEWQNALNEMKTCSKLTERELQAGPLCPHCRFNPALEKVPAPPGNLLAASDEELDRLLTEWTKTLLTNLEDPGTRENLALLPPRGKKLVNAFLKSRTLPDPVGNDFIQAVRDALTGLEKVVLRVDDLRTALLDGGSPATLPEVKKRFDDYLAGLSAGKDSNKVRIVVE
jgi:hypothetical protein